MNEVTDRHVGPYRLDKLLGQGGMGAVYQAWDERLERWVAIKQIRPESADNERIRERFRREARASARLNHPSIVQIFDILESEDGDWIVMELVEGRTLARVLEEDRPDLKRVLSLGREIAWALDAAHRKKIVHRDLKAENVLVTADGHAKILDFGLAKLVDPDRERQATLTIPGGPMGTARSMSPEQARGLELDARSDLFSFGVLLYEAITGVSPFQGRTVFDTLVRVATHEPPPLSESLPELPGELVGLVVSLLQKDPAQRPQDAGEVIELLDRLLGSAEDSGTTALRMLQLPRRSPASSTELMAPTLPESGSGKTSSKPPSATASSQASTIERLAAGAPSPPSAVRRKRAPLVATGLLVAGLAAAYFGLRSGPPVKSLYVAVRQPEVSGGAGLAGAELLATGLRVALLNTLASLEGVSPLAQEIVDPIAGSPIEVARASGADEVVSAHLSCQSETCVVSLTRLRGADGSVAWSSTFQFPLEDFHTLASASAIQLRAGYSQYPTRAGAPALEVPSEDFRELAAVLSDYRGRKAGAEALLGRLAALEKKAPSFVEPPLLASEILRLRYTESSRDAADLEGAIAAGRRATEVAPGDPRARYRLFDALVEKKDLAEAEQVLAEMEKAEPGQPEVLFRRATLESRQGHGASALPRMLAAASQQPSWKMLFRLANFELNAGKTAEARVHLEETLKLLPGHYDSLSLLAQLELMFGSLDRAAELYGQLVEQSPGVVELGNLGSVQAMLGRWDAARVSLSKAVALEPRNPFLLLNLAESEKVLDRKPEAEAHYRGVLDLLPSGAQRSAQELSVRAQALAHLGQGSEAVLAIQQALQLAPDNPQTHYEAALVYALAGERTSALVNAKQALEGGIDVRFFGPPWFDGIRAELPPAAPASP